MKKCEGDGFVLFKKELLGLIVNGSRVKLLGKYRFFDLNVSGDYISFLKISENGMSCWVVMIVVLVE